MREDSGNWFRARALASKKSKVTVPAGIKEKEMSNAGPSERLLPGGSFLRSKPEMKRNEFPMSQQSPAILPPNFCAGNYTSLAARCTGQVRWETCNEILVPFSPRFFSRAKPMFHDRFIDIDSPENGHCRGVVVFCGRRFLRSTRIFVSREPACPSWNFALKILHAACCCVSLYGRRVRRGPCNEDLVPFFSWTTRRSSADLHTATVSRKEESPQHRRATRIRRASLLRRTYAQSCETRVLELLLLIHRTR